MSISSVCLHRRQAEWIGGVNFQCILYKQHFVVFESRSVNTTCYVCIQNDVVGPMVQEVIFSKSIKQNSFER